MRNSQRFKRIAVCLMLSLLCVLLLTACKDEHTHTFDSKWASNATHHWHNATCEHTDEISGKEEHQWNGGVITTPPEHTKKGEKTFTCFVCGKTKTESVNELAEHTYNQEVANAAYIKSEANCTSGAVYYKSCVCGAKGTDTFVFGAPLGHDETSQNAKLVWEWSADYSTAKAKFICGRDASHVEEQNGVVTHVTTPATCTQLGQTVYTVVVERNGKTHTDTKTVALAIDPNAHAFASDFTVDKEATCTAEGSKSKHCTREGCNGKTEITAIPALGHDDTSQNAKLVWEWSADYSTAKAKFICGRDASHIEEQNGVVTHVTTPATCTQLGQTVYTVVVERNGKTHTDTKTVALAVDPNAHAFASDFTVDIEATCTAEGSKSKHCTREGCNDKTEITAIPKADHTIVSDAEIAPTCTQNGKEAGKHCQNCDYTEGGEPISALGHDFNTNYTAYDQTHHAATCKNGCGAKDVVECTFSETLHHNADTHYYDCSVCGNKQGEANHAYDGEDMCVCGQKDPDACEHNYIDGSNDTHHYKICEHCDRIKAGTEVAHVYDQSIATPAYLKSVASCSSGAVYYKSCVCGHHAKTEENTFTNGNPLDHNYAFAGFVWTETAGNYTARAKYVCEGNPEHIKYETAVVTSEVTKVPNCVDQGTRHYTAAYDGKTDTKDEILATNPENHKETAFTYTDNGNGTHTAYHACCEVAYQTVAHTAQSDDGDCTTDILCTICDGVVVAGQQSHNYGSWTYADETNHTHACQNPNCTAEETEAHQGGTATCLEDAVCSDCHEVYQNALGHDFNNATHANDLYHYCNREGCEGYAEHQGGTATCLENAVCSVCHEVYQNALGHDYTDVDWDTLIPATCEEPGTAYKNCTRCGESGQITKEIPALGHDYTNVVWDTLIPATCEEPGTAYKNCTRCGESGQITEEIPALGHDYTDVDWAASVSPTCEQVGTAYKNCTRCGESGQITKEISRLPHTFTVWEYNGEMHRRLCSVCNAVDYTSVGDHTFDKQVATQDYYAVAPVCGEQATYFYSCVCGAKGTETFAHGEALAHDYQDAVHTDDKYHYCNREGCEAKEAHIFGGDNICDICAYVAPWTEGLKFTNTTQNGIQGKSVAIGTATDTEIVIPSEVDGKPVIAIGYEGFKNCTSVTSIVLPNTLLKFNRGCFQGCTSLESIVIPEGVTQIADLAFSGCTSLTSVTLPSTLTSISQAAFSGCAITSVALPVGLTEIGASAFSGNAITSVDLPSSLTTIGASAFKNNIYLTGIIIPSSVTNIGNEAFKGCTALESVDLRCTLTAEQFNEGTAFSGCSGLTVFTLAEGATYAPQLYNCTSLKTVVLPNSVTELGGFISCSNLESFIIPAGVTEIKSYCFKNCGSLKSVVIHNNVTTFGDEVFYDCKALKEVLLPTGLSDISVGAFTRWSGVIYYQGTNDDFNSNVTSGLPTWIVEEKFFFYSETLPTDDANYWRFVEGIPYAWGKCEQVGHIARTYTSTNNATHTFTCDTCKEVITEEHIFDREVDKLAYLKSWADCTSGTLYYKSCACGAMGTETFEVGEPAGHRFDEVANIDNLVSPADCTHSAVYYMSCIDCYAVSEETFTYGSPLGHTGDWTVITPASCETEGLKERYCTRENCGHYETVVIPGIPHQWSSWDILSESSCTTDYVRERHCLVEGCGEVDRRVTYAAGHYFSEWTTVIAATCANGGVEERHCRNAGCTEQETRNTPALSHLWSSEKTTLTATCTHEGETRKYCTRQNCGEIVYTVVPKISHSYAPAWSHDATAHWHSASCGCDLYQDMAYHTFNGNTCTVCGYTKGATEPAVSRPQDTPIDKLKYADKAYTGFANGQSVSQLVITVASRKINDITSETLADKIASYAFDNREDITTLYIADGIVEIGEGAFKGCVNLTTVYIADSVTLIGKSAFEDCTNLTVVRLSNQLQTLEQSTFKGCIRLSNINLPNQLVTIKESAFQGCLALGDIVIPSKVTAILGSAFASSGIDSLAFAPREDLSKVMTVAPHSFAGCQSLQSVVLPDNLGIIDSQTFSDCSDLTHIYLGKVHTIQLNAFENCTSLTSIVFPNTLTTVANDSFKGCSALTDVIFNSGLDTIGARAFYGTNLSAVILPEGLRIIGEQAFYGNGDVELLVVPKSIIVAGVNSNTFESAKIKRAVVPINRLFCIVGQQNWLQQITVTKDAGGNGGIISSNTFKDFVALESATFESLISVGSYAFAGCTNLKNVTIEQHSNGVSSTDIISEWAFSGCTNLKTVLIHNKAVIDSNAFNGCTNLAVVIIDYSSKIRANAFEGCTNIECFIVQDSGMDTVDENAFSGCFVKYAWVPASMRSTMPEESMISAIYKAFGGNTVIVVY